ncbi:hypothetical protein B0H17DRAFT_1217613 [Mycena rosella]|uniref:CxC2-like cysteine cluster KDZ transposase-associated domain-containing protein n=1 Tax=Mycena rosella TaxID=1033263 RepID=A0AAD7FQ05_MYCRO|nr:hypothetical protein B0H17DRAFT_1217613 [Mycena rosella]
MKRIGNRKKAMNTSILLLASSVPQYTVSYHTGTTAARSEKWYVPEVTVPRPAVFHSTLDIDMPPTEEPALPFHDATGESPDVIPAYETTKPCNEKGATKTRQNVAHMDELKSQQGVFLETLLSRYHDPLVLTPCSCDDTRVRKVGCSDCIQPALLCPQCWLNKHRTLPMHWALIWNTKDRFFEKYDFCRVMKNGSVAIGHHGHRCPQADLGRSFTLVDMNGIHATVLTFCRGNNGEGQCGAPNFQQLLKAGIFPGSVKDPKTGYTLAVLEYFRQLRSQGKGSAYNFVRVLSRMADPFFSGSVPDIYINFLAVSQFYEYLYIVMDRGHAHMPDVPLPGEVDRPYPNRPNGYLGLNCGACPERGVNMPLIVNVPRYLRHLISQHLTLDGNFKANLFFKRDDGSDKALTDGTMYFPVQQEFERISKEYVIPDEDKEVPCKAHIGSIRHQGQVKYGNTAVSGVIACACDHAIAGSFVDMLKGEAFALGALMHNASILNMPTPRRTHQMNMVKRAIALFPDETALHMLLVKVEGQIPADHIRGHGPGCQACWQAVYFWCRAHFHGETAEVLWAFLNPLGSSTRQMTEAARHNTINFVMDAWNTWKVLRQAELLAAEQLDALHLFELHMAVVEDLSRQHAAEVAGWSRLSRKTTQSAGGNIRSVYQHESTKVITIESMLAGLDAAERERAKREAGTQPTTSVAQWIHAGMAIQRQQVLVVALLTSHREHPLQETWATIAKLRDSLNVDLKKFRERQRAIYSRVTLSALDVDKPELTAIQHPSYRMKHSQRSADADADNHDTQLREAETQLRCGEANSGILAVRAASLALSAVKKAGDLDYRGQAGITCSQRSLQKAQLIQEFEITMYNRARAALIHLGYMKKNADEPYSPLSHRDTCRKDTHLHRATGDSRLFDGTAWYLQSGVKISRVAPMLSPIKRRQDGDAEPQLLAGTQTLKRAGFTRSPRPPKRLKQIAPDDVIVESSASEAEDSDVGMSPSKGAKQGATKGPTKKVKGKGKRAEGWIWKEVGRDQTLDEDKLAEYKRESDRVQWFRAEAEMYRWLEQYKRKHVELMRVIARFRRDSEVWGKRADREEGLSGGVNGSASFARMQAAMYQRLQHNAEVIFKSPDSGAHHDWVSSTTFDELVTKIDAWRDVVFKWMDAMDIHRAYKDG